MKHANIPIFVPHLGCPHDCVFCNQRTITGKSGFVPEDAERDIEKALSTIDSANTETEIAFFGGSFTGIDRELMLSLLSISDKYVDAGYVSAVRCSTRPDYINNEILNVLSDHHVKTIEIGVQSMSDAVLGACMRGHTAAETENACRLIVSRGFKLVGQMMIGLPESSPDDEQKTAQAICSLGASGARIYPTVVFADTALDRMRLSGTYEPLSVDDAVVRSAAVLDVFLKHDVGVIRVGLCEYEGLHTSSGITAGAFHPALGELCFSELYFRRITSLLDSLETPPKGNIIIETAPGTLSKAVGQHGMNRKKLAGRYPDCLFCFAESSLLSGFGIAVRAGI